MVRHDAELQRGSRQRSFFSLLRARPALSAVLGICLLFCLLSTSVLALAAQVTDPASPLYGLKHWEQHVQLQLSGSPADQAALDLQFARDRLKTLLSLVDTAQASAYRQALADLDQQVNAAAAAINELALLGDTVPLVRQASLSLPAHPNERSTISFTGLDLQPGAHLLVATRTAMGISQRPRQRRTGTNRR